MYTSHGHLIPGTLPLEDKPEFVARCGGVGLCPSCTREARSSGFDVAPEDQKGAPDKSDEVFISLTFNEANKEVLTEVVRFAVGLGENFHLSVDDAITTEDLIHDEND